MTRIDKILELYPDLTAAAASLLDYKLVAATEKIFDIINETTFEGFDDNMVGALLLAYVHNNIEGIFKK